LTQANLPNFSFAKYAEAYRVIGTPDLYFSDYDNPNGTGEKFAGINLLGKRNDEIFRGCEYLLVKLKKPLMKDSLYSVSFEYRLNSHFIKPSYVSNCLGFYLFEDCTHFTNRLENTVRPIVESEYTINEISSDSLWHKFKVSYKARGEEKFLLIGDVLSGQLIYDPPSTVIESNSYFYIDNVRVQK